LITSYYISVNGVKICVETNNGPNDKGTVVCFGSAGRESRQFHGMMECLQGNFNVVAFDMPGHGKSWPLNGNSLFSEYHEYCDFIIAVLQKLGISNPICVGCALGGNVTYYLAQHVKVRAIISMAGTDYSPHVDKSVSDNLDHPYCSVQHSHFDFTDSLIGSATSPEDREFILWGVCTEVGKAKAADYGGVYNGFDVRDGMNLVTCPVLVIRGEEDWTVQDETFNPLLERLTAAAAVEYVVLSGLSHYNPQESPRLVSDTMLSFLSKVEQNKNMGGNAL